MTNFNNQFTKWPYTELPPSPLMFYLDGRYTKKLPPDEEIAKQLSFPIQVTRCPHCGTLAWSRLPSDFVACPVAHCKDLQP